MRRKETLYALANERVVMYYIRKNYEIQRADIGLLLELDPYKLFTISNFKDGTLLCGWDSTRFYRLLEEGWIECCFKRVKRTDHNKYRLTFKANCLVARIYRLLSGEERIPESKRRNKIMRGESYSDRRGIEAIQKFNRKETLT